MGAGAVLGATAAICLGLRVLSFQQAIAMAVPAVALLGGGLVALALPDPSTGRRRGAETGFLIGTLLSLFRPGTRERGDGAEPNNHALA